MGADDSGRVGRDDAKLFEMLWHVNKARSEFRTGRANPGRNGSVVDLGRLAAQVAETMQAYADAASSSGIPLPYRFRDELRLYRAMATHGWVRNGRTPTTGAR